jgi:hypothetical protein
LWSYDGSNASMVADINPGQYGSEVSELTVFNNQLFFSADDGFMRLHNLEPKVFMLSAVPEPSALALLATACLGMLFYGAWRRKTTRRLS